MDDLSYAFSSAVDPTTAFCTDEGQVRISVMEAKYLIRHFRIRGSDSEKHHELRTLINGMCTTSVGRTGLQHLLQQAHAK